MKNIIIDGKNFDISSYSSLEDLVDCEFEGKDLSKIEVEDFEDIPDRLVYKTPVPCTLEEALEDTEGFDTIFDWVDYVQDNDEKATIAYIDIEDLARYISLDYIFIDGYVFENI